MKAVLLAIVLVALLVVVSAHRRPIIKQKIQSDSDAEFLKKLGKIAKKIVPIAQKAFEVYGKVKSFGILADKVSAKNSTAPAKPKSRKPKSQKPKSQKPKSRKPKSDKPASRKPRSCKKVKSQKPKSRKPKSQKPKKVNKVEADFGALLGLAAKKLIVQKGLDLLKKKLSKKGNKSNKTETEADAEFLKKLGKKLGGVVKKIAPIAAKAFEIYSNVKSFGAASVLKKLATDKLKKLVADKIAKNPKLAKIAGFAGKAKDLIGKAKEFGLFSDSENVNCGEAYERGQRLGSMTCTTINGKLVTLGTASAFLKMKQAASKAGVTLTLNSGFRKMSEQQHLYNCYKTKKCNNGNLAAKPGFSNHQNGKALDISVVSSKTYNWLANNASKYGFVRTVPSEKWHWELRHSSCNKFVRYSCK